MIKLLTVHSYLPNTNSTPTTTTVTTTGTMTPITTTTTTATTTGTVTCQAGWSQFGGKCYKFMKDTKVWSEARDDCLSQQVL